MDEVKVGDFVVFGGKDAVVLAPFEVSIKGGPREQQICCDPVHGGWLWNIQYIESGKMQAGVCQAIMKEPPE